MPWPPHASALERVVALTTKGLTAVALVFLILPIVVIVPLSFTSGELLIYPLPGWSLRWYEELTTDGVWTHAAWNSLRLAAITTLTATLLGTVAAYGLHHLRGPLRAGLFGLLGLPLVVPAVIAAVAVYNFYAPLHLVGTFAGVALAHTALAIPFVVFTVVAALRRLDPQLGRAAASLGATPVQTFVRVTLPVILPGLLSGSVLAFVTSFDELLIAQFNGGPDLPTLPRLIFSGVSEAMRPTIASAAVVLVVVSVVLMFVVEALRRRVARLRGPASHS